MIRKIIYISIVAFLLQTASLNAGTTGSEELKDSGPQGTAGECFEGFSRAMFSFNHALDSAIFEPVAKGYRTLPMPIEFSFKFLCLPQHDFPACQATYLS